MSALQAEVDSLLDAAEEARQTHREPIRAWECTVDGIEVTIAIGRLGKVGAATTATLVHQWFQPRLIVFTGVAGGLDPGLGIGDIVIAERTIQHDAGYVDGRGLVRYQPGHVPFFNPTDRFGYEPSGALLERVLEAMEDFEPRPVLGRRPRVATGTILTGDQFVNDETTRQRLFGELGGLAVEMEGAALAQTADILGIDHLVIRSVSDLAGAESIDDFARFLEDVAHNSAQLVRHLLPVL